MTDDSLTSLNGQKKRNVVLLGATGSIGTNAIRELEDLPDAFRTVGLVARTNTALLARQARRLAADTVITTDETRLHQLTAEAPASSRALAGNQAMIELVTRPDVDVVLCAILGRAALPPVLAALKAGKLVALASKEVLCMAGELVIAAAQNSPGGALIPVDSEHSGLFQCLQGRPKRHVRKLWITASGGPFRNASADEIASATIERALKHPTWSMGAKISIDSATLMNKALELIEAHYLFTMPADRLEAVIHPQSKVHALVELIDGTFLAQLSAPDMRMAIRYALAFPNRLPGHAQPLSPLTMGTLDFQPVDTRRFPAIPLGHEAIRRGGTAPTVLNAANDVAVTRFLNGQIPFPKIWDIAEKTLLAFSPAPQTSPEQIDDADKEARAFASKL